MAARRLDASRDTVIEEAVLDLLIEVGYDRLTMDAVAARARAGKATLYRRWSSKADMVADAVAHLVHKGQACGEIDTGSLRGDLIALSCSKVGLSDLRQLRVVVGMATAMRSDPELAQVWRERFLRPKQEEMLRCFVRARERGELAPGVDIDVIMVTLPALIFFHVMFTDEPLDQALITRLVDAVILPAATNPGSSAMVASVTDEH